MALRQLIDRHGDKLTEAELVLLSGLLIQAQQGHLPAFNQVARVSQLRVELGRRRNKLSERAPEPDDAADWNGAA
jgi:hypothetical protein